MATGRPTRKTIQNFVLYYKDEDGGFAHLADKSGGQLGTFVFRADKPQWFEAFTPDGASQGYYDRPTDAALYLWNLKHGYQNNPGCVRNAGYPQATAEAMAQFHQLDRQQRERAEAARRAAIEAQRKLEEEWYWKNPEAWHEYAPGYEFAGSPWHEVGVMEQERRMRAPTPKKRAKKPRTFGGKLSAHRRAIRNA